MTKSKNLFKNISLMFCLVPMLLLAFVVMFPKNNILFVSANYSDPNYTFNGSNTINVATDYNISGPTKYGILNIKFNLHKVDGVLIVDEFGYGQYHENTNSFSLLYDFEGTCHIYNTDYIAHDVFLTDYAWFKMSYVLSDMNFNCNVYKVRYYSELVENTYMVTHIVYYDVNDYTLDCRILCYGSEQYAEYSKLALSDRTYYFTPDLSDNSIYNEGYNAGYTDGNSAGNSSGYKDGYSAGETIGYGNGYNAGLEQSDKYSFNSLIGAVIDAPVSAFTSLLNFELLGVNILGLITGLLSLAVIVLIIKLCMGGR